MHCTDNMHSFLMLKEVTHLETIVLPRVKYIQLNFTEMVNDLRVSFPIFG